MANTKSRIKANQQKWSQTLMKAGFTIIPDVLLEHQHDLGLDAIDINILFHLARYWWEASNLPHPSKRTIAEKMGVDASTVRRRIAKMERVGTIKRRPRFGSDQRREANDYDFTDLIKRATPLAQKMTEKRDQKRRARSQRLTSKRTPKAVGK